MKVRLLCDVPAHGLTTGRVLDAVQAPDGSDFQCIQTWARGDMGEPVLLQPHEYEKLPEHPCQGP